MAEKATDSKNLDSQPALFRCLIHEQAKSIVALQVKKKELKDNMVVGFGITT